jgi:hypothetical protein
VDPEFYEFAFQSKYGKCRIFKISGASQESKDWVADPANRICDAPGSWYCSGQYPPALAETIAKRKNFRQLEDFNAKAASAAEIEYNAKYMDDGSGGGDADKDAKKKKWEERRKARAAAKAADAEGGADAEEEEEEPEPEPEPEPEKPKKDFTSKAGTEMSQYELTVQNCITSYRGGAKDGFKEAKGCFDNLVEEGGGGKDPIVLAYLAHSLLLDAPEQTEERRAEQTESAMTTAKRAFRKLDSDCRADGSECQPGRASAHDFRDTDHYDLKMWILRVQTEAAIALNRKEDAVASASKAIKDKTNGGDSDHVNVLKESLGKVGCWEGGGFGRPCPWACCRRWVAVAVGGCWRLLAVGVFWWLLVAVHVHELLVRMVLTVVVCGS